jgi:glutamine amidotransferase
MTNLRARGLIEPLTHRVLEERTPILGICLGMQLFSESSEEGSLAGLGWIPGRTVKFACGAERPIKIPHMGWNEVEFDARFPLASGMQGDARFYFVHSYHVVCSEPANVAGTANYGSKFTAAVQRTNIMGVQFHPEKSHRYGMRLLSNFQALARRCDRA